MISRRIRCCRSHAPTREEIVEAISATSAAAPVGADRRGHRAAANGCGQNRPAGDAMAPGQPFPSPPREDRRFVVGKGNFAATSAAGRNTSRW
jgi:hypothetical protein